MRWATEKGHDNATKALRGELAYHERMRLLFPERFEIQQMALYRLSLFRAKEWVCGLAFTP